jgi:hypothetical protein
MGLDIRIGNKYKLPLYETGAFAAGCYIGFCEGKGVDSSQTVEYLTKYGPTAFSALTTPFLRKASNMYGWRIYNLMKEQFDSGEMDIPQDDGESTKLRDLPKDQRLFTDRRIEHGLENMVERLENPQYAKATVANTFTAAAATGLGYALGRVTSNFF